MGDLQGRSGAAGSPEGLSPARQALNWPGTETEWGCAYVSCFLVVISRDFLWRHQIWQARHLVSKTVNVYRPTYLSPNHLSVSTYNPNCLYDMKLSPKFFALSTSIKSVIFHSNLYASVRNFGPTAFVKDRIPSSCSLYLHEEVVSPRFYHSKWSTYCLLVVSKYLGNFSCSSAKPGVHISKAGVRWCSSL